MASRIIDKIYYTNPRTGRVLTSLKTITNLIKNRTFDVPNGLILNEANRLVLDNKRNRKANLYIEGRYTMSYEERFNKDLFETDGYRYPLNVIRNSGLNGNISITYVFDDKRPNRTHRYTLPTNGSLNSWWNEGKWEDWKDKYDGPFIFEKANDDVIDDINPYNQGKFIIIPEITPIPKNITQRFRHGISNCLLTPIKTYFVNLHKNEEVKNKRYELSKKIRQIETYEEQFKKGVPENEIQNITETLKIKIKINDIQGNTMIENRAQTVRIFKVFEYINTKLNHVELINLDKQEITEEEFNEIVNNAEEGDYYTKNTITNKDGTFFYKDRVAEEVYEWEQSQHIDSMEYYKNPDQNELVLHSLHYGGDISYDNSIELGSLKCLDHKKSYYNFRKCDLYKKFKFPVCPTEYRKIPKDFPFEKYTGFWLIDNVNWEELTQEVKIHLSKLNIYNAARAFNTPELYFMKHELKIKFDLKVGAWGHETQDIDMEGLLKICPYCEKCKTSKEKCEKCKNKRAPYKTWAGKKASVKLDTTIKLKGPEKMASLIEFNNPGRTKYDAHNKTILIATRKTKVYHKAHISSYILSYSRIQILRQLLKMPFNKVARVQLDGIFYAELDIEAPENFQNKPVSNYKCGANPESYISSYRTRPFNAPELEEWNKHRIINGFGEAGAGKSRYFLTQAKLINPCYVAKEHKIIQEKREEYGITNTSTLQRLLIDSYNPADTSTLLIDESSKLNNTEVSKIVEKYNRSKIIFIGDSCQLPPFSTSSDKLIRTKESERPDYSKFYQYEFKTNYRCKCPKLKEILDALRNMIITNKPLREINDFFLASLEQNKGTDENYNVNEYIICGTHDEIDYYTQKHSNKPKKWIIEKTNEKYNAGTILIQEDKPASSALRHAFTGTATQGITIKSPEKLYISPDGLFCREMAYTVLSRVEYLDQVVLLRSLKDDEKFKKIVQENKKKKSTF